MKTMKISLTNFILVLFASALFTMNSCEPEQGPIGPAGTAGTAGTAGIDGVDGADGAVNVVSINYTVSLNDWNEHGDFGIDKYYDVTINLPAITSDIIDKGAVLVYTYDEGSWYPLPLTIVDGYGDQTWFILCDYSYKIGSVTIEIVDSDFETYLPSSALGFKVVIIEGNPLV